jgi:hypothetical protein
MANMKDVGTLLLFLLGSLAVFVSAQTPPGFSPSTSRNLYVEFDDVTVTPGKLIPLDRMSFFCPALPAPSSTHLSLQSQQLHQRFPSHTARRNQPISSL